MSNENLSSIFIDFSNQAKKFSRLSVFFSAIACLFCIFAYSAFHSKILSFLVFFVTFYCDLYCYNSSLMYSSSADEIYKKVNHFSFENIDNSITISRPKLYIPFNLIPFMSLEHISFWLSYVIFFFFIFITRL